MISKLLRYIKRLITNNFIDDDFLNQKIKNKKINHLCSLATLDIDSRFYEEADVVNMQNDKSKIIIGKNTHIRGELLIMPYSGGITIGNCCYIGKNTTVRAYDKIIIGNNVLIAHNVTIIDSDSHEIDYIERQKGFSKLILEGHGKDKGRIICAPITIKDNVWISYNVSLLKGITVGEGAIIAAGSVVTKDVEPFTIVAGNPAHEIKKL